MKKIKDKGLLLKYLEDTNLQEQTGVDLFYVSELFSFERDEFLIYEGIKSEHVYFLVEGQVVVYSYTKSGKILPKAYFHQVEILGESDVLWGGLGANSIKALTGGFCIAINIARHRAILQYNTNFLRYVNRIISKRINDKFQDSLIEPVELRTAEFILKHSTGCIFSRKIVDCALILFVRTSTLHQVLKKFSDLGIIQKREREKDYIITDRDQLIKIAEGTLI